MTSVKRLAKLIIKCFVFLFMGGMVSYLLKPKIAKPQFVSHDRWVDYLVDKFDKEGIRILEIGSRAVTTNIDKSVAKRFKKASYVGIDVLEGPNVDVCGDVHRLTDYFSPNSFDLIYSSAVFEHLYAPWIVAEEISKVLKLGGFCFIETHFSFSSHERPWHFFQFSDMALKVLFNKSLGFEVLDCGMDNPMIGLFGSRSCSHLRFLPVRELYCHSEILCRKISSVGTFNWRHVPVEHIVGDTMYPDRAS